MVKETIIDILPNALSVALSPMSIAALILLFFGKKSKISGLVFTIGWFIGIIASEVVFSHIFSQAGDGGSKKLFSAIIDTLLGMLLLYFALREWRHRPKKRTKNLQPKWMQEIEAISLPKAFLVGLLFSAINSKNTVLNIASATEIGKSVSSFADIVAVSLIYAFVCSITFMSLVVAFLMFNKRVSKPLQIMKRWLILNNATIMCVLFLLLGANFIFKGITAIIRIL